MNVNPLTNNKGAFQATAAWWDTTSFCAANPHIAKIARGLTMAQMASMSRPGFRVHTWDNEQEFYLSMALEQLGPLADSTPDNPQMIVAPVGPTEQMKLMAMVANDRRINLKHGIFAGMDNFAVLDGDRYVAMPDDDPLSFVRTNLDEWVNLLDENLRIPRENMYFPSEDIASYAKIFHWDLLFRRVLGGMGDTDHIAFDDPEQQEGKYADVPPTPDEYCAKGTRLVRLHPATIVQDARHSTAGEQWVIPTHAFTVGMKEMLMAEEICIWHPGHHASPFGLRLATLLLYERVETACVPMSMLARHPNVHFHFLAPKIQDAGWETH